jgi:hypothetical protein
MRTFNFQCKWADAAGAARSCGRSLREGPRPMVGGFNTNVRYRGRTFHVQTEDSGPNVAKIVTLLYEGGSILFSRKTAYRGDAASSSPVAVRTLMETQHREMVEALKAGQLDVEIGLADSEDEVATPRPMPVSPPPRAPAPSAAPVPARPQAPAPRAGVAPARPASGRTTERPSESAHRDFGQGVITQKPLDEVVLALLALK